MKDGTPAWSVVVVAVRDPRLVLALSRGFSPRDPALPGGDSEPEDLTPADTAKRELFEETGVTALELESFGQWFGERGQPVYGFFVSKWRGSRLRSSGEGKAFWASPESLLLKSAYYRVEAKHIFERLGIL